MRTRRVILGVILTLAVALSALFAIYALPSSEGSVQSSSLAPDFTLTDIFGNNFTLSDYRTSSVVVIEFTSLSCSECKIVEQSLKSVYTTYDPNGGGSVQILSVFIEPQFGDTIPALQAHYASSNITWPVAQDTMGLSVSRAYAVSDIPTVFIVDRQGQLVYDVSGAQSTSQLDSSVSAALSGRAAPIQIVGVSLIALAAIAGVTTFFSPCAFPMFPGYMGLFLGLNSGTAASGNGAGGAYKGAVRRAAVAGSVTAFGMILVFLIIGVALIIAASAISGYIPYFSIVVGVVLVALGALLLTNLQYWRIVTPFQNLWKRLRGRGTSAVAASVTPMGGDRMYVKLFSYGMGYAAAAAGCVAPVIFSAIVAGLAIGPVSGMVNVLILCVTAAALMIGVTIGLAMAGQRYVNKLKAWTPTIKKISAVALIVVGVYLVYFFYSAWLA